MSVKINKDGCLIETSNQSGLNAIENHHQHIEAILTLIMQRDPDCVDNEPVYFALDKVKQMLPDYQQIVKSLKE